MDSALENPEVRKQLQQLGDFISQVLSGDVKLKSDSWTTRAGEKRSAVHISADITRQGTGQSFSLLVRQQAVCTFYWHRHATAYDVGSEPVPSLESESRQDANSG